MLKHNQYTIPLKTGNLELVVEPSIYSLGGLLDFASRENPHRAYLFLSKVLGKYIPCLPSEMRKSFQDLSRKIKVNGDTLVLGVAETATGLGAGVAEEINKECGFSVYYSQTTRFEFNKPLAFSINEEHSHAPKHLIYDLSDNIDLNSVAEVVLVDDEISTGKTLSQITKGIREYLPNLKVVHWTSLVNWISESECSAFKEEHIDIELHYHSLLRGGFSFKKTSDKVIEFPVSTAAGLSTAVCRHDTGRTGINVGDLKRFTFVDENKDQVNALSLQKEDQYVIVGTGEFTYPPYLFAEALENSGYDVVFESTGRSPILPGGGISSKLKFYDEANQANYYLYNLPENRKPIVMYETFEQFSACPLHKLLNCKAAILGDE